MKGKFFRRYLEIFILFAMIIIFYKMFDSISVIIQGFFNLAGILRSFIYGGIMAFFLYPVVVKLEEKIEATNLESIKKKKRIYSTVIVFASFLLLIIISFRFLIPVLIDNTIEFVMKLNDSKSMVIDYINKYLTEPYYNKMAVDFIRDLDLKTFIENQDINAITHTAISSITEVFDVLIGIVLCPYVIYEKENLFIIFNNILGLFVSEETIKTVNNYFTASSIIFYNFIFGKLIDSLIIGLIALVYFLIVGSKFAIVYALVIGITNMIPYFGPFIGGIPITGIVFITEGLTPALMCAVFVFLLQQFDGFILGPHILGGQVGVRPLWIIFSITFFGGLFGFVGMFVGVPLIAICGMLLNDLTRYHKHRKRQEEKERQINETNGLVK